MKSLMYGTSYHQEGEKKTYSSIIHAPYTLYTHTSYTLYTLHTSYTPQTLHIPYSPLLKYFSTVRLIETVH